MCGKITTEAADEHIPNADDGDCTTDITCSVCGTVTTKGAEAHSYGEWVIIKPATAAEDGSRERTCSACGNKDTDVINATGETIDSEESTESEETTEAEESTETDETASETMVDGPDTGDTSKIGMWLLMAVIATAAIIRFVIFSNKEY